MTTQSMPPSDAQPTDQIPIDADLDDDGPTAAVITPGQKGNPIWRVFRSAQPVGWRLLLAGVLGALAIGSSVGLIATSAFLISKASLQPPVLWLQVSIVMVRAFGIGRGVFRYAERVTGHDAAFRSLTDLRIAIFDRLATIAPSGSQMWRSGDLLSRLTSDVDAMLDLHLRVALPYFAAILVSIGSVILVGAFVPMAGVALALALLIGGVVVPAITLRLSAATQKLVAPATGKLSAEAVSLVDHGAELIVLGREKEALAKIQEADTELTSAASRAAKSAGLAGGIGVLAQGFAIVIALIAGTNAVTSGALDGVNLALIVLVPLAAYEAVQVLPAAVLALARVREAAVRIVSVIDVPDPVPDPQNPVALEHITPGQELHLANVSCGWQPGDWVLRDVNLRITPGVPTAIVGPSGIGKSTLAAAIDRLAPSSGDIRYGDVDMANLAGHDVRRIVGLAQQDPHLFDTTIAENVRLANRAATDAQIQAALTAVGLWEWIEELPNGMETKVGRFGNEVSGGQQQRIGVARVLIGDQQVVVADEPTEHLDADNAALVMSALIEHCQDRVLLVITHRVADAARCTEVYRVREGTVARQELA